MVDKFRPFDRVKYSKAGNDVGTVWHKAPCPEGVYAVMPDHGTASGYPIAMDECNLILVERPLNFKEMEKDRDRWKAIAEALYEGARQDGSGNHLPLIEAYHRYEEAKRMTNVTNSETPAEARERLAKAVESFDGTDEEARKLSNQCALACGFWWNQTLNKWVHNDGRQLREGCLINAQDALDLLPEGWDLCRLEMVGQGYKVELVQWRKEEATDLFLEAEDKTIQAAITAAALRAGG